MSTMEKSSRVTWTSEEDQRLIHAAIFPKRSRAAVAWRWSMLTKNEDQPPSMTDHPARHRQRGPRPRRDCRGGLRFASQRSARDYKPRQVNDTIEDDDDRSWNSSESDEGEQAAGMAEDARDDAMLDEAPVAAAASITAIPQARPAQLQQPIGPETEMPTTLAGPRQSVEETGVPSTGRQYGKAPTFRTRPVPTYHVRMVKWHGEGHTAPNTDRAQLGQTTSPGLGTGSALRSVIAEAAAETPAPLTRASDPASASPTIPRLSEVARQQETMMVQILAENSRLRTELRDLTAAYNEVVSERDQLRDDCRIVRQLENKGVLDLFAQWARQ
ncbi:hypothetical protein BDV11DRAFT_170988 [Aspergillus similis]